MSLPSFEKPGLFYLGKLYDNQTCNVKDEELLYPSKDLTTHAVCLGMTGSGKTGLGISMIEEAALDSIPSIVIDPKGDLGNLLLTFPNLSAEEFKPWIDHGEAERKGMSHDLYAEEVAKTWKDGLQSFGQSPKRIQDLQQNVSINIYTPASRSGIPISILSSFKAPAKEFLADSEAMRERILSTASSILGLIGIAADPIKSREHILISTILDNSWRKEKDVDLPFLIREVQNPSFDKVGVLDVDTFFPPKDRLALSVSLNNLLASPGFHAWMEGVPMDIGQLLYTDEAKPKISVISIAHLSDAERMFFVTLFLNQLIGWMRKQSGTSSLRAIFYMDEIFGYFPPTATPPSKAPMMTLLKQARAFGLGIILSTQNPVDLDYKGLSNCGTWFIGRLQTARDKMRVVEGLTAASNGDIDAKAMDQLMSEMVSRVFIMRSIYAKEPVLFQTRWTLSYLRGPLTLGQIELLTQNEKKDFGLLQTNGDHWIKHGTKGGIPSGVSQYSIRSSGSSKAVYYRPLIAGFAKVHFVDKKMNVDEWKRVNLVVEPDGEAKALSWDSAENHPDLKEKLTQTQIDEKATYQEIPTGMLNEKNYLAYRSDLISFLYQKMSLPLYEYKQLKLVSKAQESEADFRLRVIIALKSQREIEIQKVKDGYEKKITILKEKIRKGEEKKSQQQVQSWVQKFEAFLSMLTTIFGAVFGRRMTKTTITQAGTTVRRMGRVGKESQDVVIAEENLKALQQQLEEVQLQQETEIAKLAVDVDPSHLQIDEVQIKPVKTDIAVDEIAVVWWPS